MRLKKIAQRFAVCLALLTMTAGVGASNDKPYPIPDGYGPSVYATPLSNMVILQFMLYDRVTWCRLYIRKEAWDFARQNGGELPAEFDPGQMQCERRER